jgi:hypothetical protein
MPDELKPYHVQGFYAVIVAIIGAVALVAGVILTSYLTRPQEQEPVHNNTSNNSLVILPIEFEVADVRDAGVLTRREYRTSASTKPPLVERSCFRLGYMCTAALPVQVTEVGFIVDSLKLRQLDDSAPFVLTVSDNENENIFILNPEVGKEYSTKESQLVNNNSSCESFVELFWSGAPWQSLEVTGRFWVGNEKGRKYSQATKAVFLSPPSNVEPILTEPRLN